MKKTLLPIHVLILFLVALAAWSTFLWNGSDGEMWLISIRNLVALAASGFLVRLAIRSLIDESLVSRHEHRTITILILFLLFDSLAPWWLFIALGVVTELARYFLRTPLGPLFNPAALGALIVSLGGYLPSWWGVNPAPRIPLMGVDISVMAWIVALGAAYVVYRYRKLTVALSNVIAFSITYFVLTGVNPSYFVLEGTLLFFILVMVCEPKTSPIPTREQIIYGALVGILFALGLHFQFVEASLIALILGNLYVGRNYLRTLFPTQEKENVVSSS